MSGTSTGLRAAQRPLAAAHDVALFDLDGVVYVGRKAVPHAVDAITLIGTRFGMRSAFVTNNASRPPAAVAEHLRSFGLDVDESDVVTSAQAAARVLAGMLPAGSRVLLLGGAGLRVALAERGLVPVDSVDDDPVAVVQGYNPDMTWRDLAEAAFGINRGLPWVASNTDATVPTPRGIAPGNGSLVMALRHATGATPLVAGKPEPPLMKESVERTNAVNPIVIGDRLDTDIEGANRAGLASLLVFTGVTDVAALLRARPHERPTYIGQDLRSLLVPHPAATIVDAGRGRCADVDVDVVGGGFVVTGPHSPQLRKGLFHKWRDSRRPGFNDGLNLVRAACVASWNAADEGRDIDVDHVAAQVVNNL